MGSQHDLTLFEHGEVLGPFTLQATDKAYRFEVDALGKAPRLGVMQHSGGTTGL